MNGPYVIVMLDGNNDMSWSTQRFQEQRPSASSWAKDRRSISLLRDKDVESQHSIGFIDHRGQMMVKTPFRIVIDSAEQSPFKFDNIYSDADKKYARFSIETTVQCLGRHPNSLGDYSFVVPGLGSAIGRCHIERKSAADLQSTLLGFNDGHRARLNRSLPTWQSLKLLVLSLSLRSVKSLRQSTNTARRLLLTTPRSSLAH